MIEGVDRAGVDNPLLRVVVLLLGVGDLMLGTSDGVNDGDRSY